MKRLRWTDDQGREMISPVGAVYIAANGGGGFTVSSLTEVELIEDGTGPSAYVASEPRLGE